MIDLHALRTTLGTQLARAGVAPQIAQRIMRHGDYRTTLKHYTVLGLTDTAGAVERLPGIGSDPDAARATGTHDASPETDPQPYPQQLERRTVRSDASRRDESAHRTHRPTNDKPRTDAARPQTRRDAVRGHASKRAKGLEPSTFSLEG